MKDLAKEILIEIVRLSGGLFEGKTRLYKAFYFAHLFYFETAHGQVLSEWAIVRMPEGPGIAGGDKLLKELVAEGVLETYSQRNGPFSEVVYRLIGEPKTSLDAIAIGAIREACAYVDGRSGSELSALTHDRSRSWKTAANGGDLNIYPDILPDDEYEEQHQQVLDAQQAIQTFLGIAKS